ncbi:DsbA family protein [Pontibacter fetidus]|uniref:DsbA family protein n=1 Tax=Pontibacter fetidus TaxID=2700082 RepID=A0A6B2H2I6_9BACT|nr:DsbA family protein [Pontibacter fetidus]NDK56591.1 DsbA family protein [Pontibacter fetidus]
MLQSSNTPTILYVTNPMCSWCYGFTQVVRRLAALWRGRLQVQVQLGNLQAYATEPLQREERERLATSWHWVQQRTHLPFDFRFFLQKHYVFDTEPACRALLCMRLLRPVLTLEVLRALHSAFFADGLDLTDTAVLTNIARMFGVSENLFLTLFESEEVMQQLDEEFEAVARLGATNFPSVFLQTRQGVELVSKGFCQLDELEQRLLSHL